MIGVVWGWEQRRFRCGSAHSGLATASGNGVLGEFLGEPLENLSAGQGSGLTSEARSRLRALAMLDISDEALSQIEAALHDFPDDPEIQKYAGVIRYRRKEYALSEPLLTRATASAPKDIETATFLMRVHYNSGNDEKCEVAARALNALASDNVDSLRTLGRLYNRRAQWDRAADAWQRVAQINPKDAEAPLQAARCHQRLGHAEQVLHFSEKALAFDAGNTDALRLNFDSATSLGRYDRLSPVIARCFDLDHILVLDLIHRLAQGEGLAAAAEMLSMLLEARPENDPIREAAKAATEDWRTLAVRSELRRDDKAAAHYLCALRTLNPGDPVLTESIGRVKSYFVATLKDTSLVGNSADSDRQIAETALMLDPTTHEAWFALGQNRLMDNDPAGARPFLQKATGYNPENQRYWAYYGRALRQNGEHIMATGAYRRVVELARGQKNPYTLEADKALSQFPSMMIANARQALEEGRPMVALAVHEFFVAEAPGNPALAALFSGATHTLLNAVRQTYKAQSPLARMLAEYYLAHEPESGEVELILARTLMREKAYEAALPIWEKLSSSAPQDAHYHLQIARCHARLGNGEAAKATARKVLELDPAISEAGTIITQF